jgi:hypothetical protein
MNTHDELNITIVNDGAVVVGNTVIKKFSSEITCITVHLVSKYARVYSYNKPVFWLYAVDINDKVSLENPTVITFPDFEGWEIFSISTPGRYSFNMTLVKKT